MELKAKKYGIFNRNKIVTVILFFYLTNDQNYEWPQKILKELSTKTNFSPCIKYDVREQ